jgi:hypothetical protein
MPMRRAMLPGSGVAVGARETLSSPIKVPILAEDPWIRTEVLATVGVKLKENDFQKVVPTVVPAPVSSLLNVWLKPATVAVTPSGDSGSEAS